MVDVSRPSILLRADNPNPATKQAPQHQPYITKGQTPSKPEWYNPTTPLGFRFRNSDLWDRARATPGGLVLKAHRRLYHSTLGLRVIMKIKKKEPPGVRTTDALPLLGSPTIPKLTRCLRGTNLSTLERKRAWAHQVCEPK